MSIVLLLIFASLTLALCAFGAFIWAVRAGQFEDTCTPSLRILTDQTGSETIPNQARNTDTKIT